MINRSTDYDKKQSMYIFIFSEQGHKERNTNNQVETYINIYSLIMKISSWLTDQHTMMRKQLMHVFGKECLNPEYIL